MLFRSHPTEIATATQTHCELVYRTDQIPFNPSDFTVDTILSNIHSTFCNNYIELLAAIYGLNELLKNNPRVSSKNFKKLP